MLDVELHNFGHFSCPSHIENTGISETSIRIDSSSKESLKGKTLHAAPPQNLEKAEKRIEDLNSRLNVAEKIKKAGNILRYFYEIPSFLFLVLHVFCEYFPSITHSIDSNIVSIVTTVIAGLVLVLKCVSMGFLWKSHRMLLSSCKELWDLELRHPALKQKIYKGQSEGVHQYRYKVHTKLQPNPICIQNKFFSQETMQKIEQNRHLLKSGNIGVSVMDWMEKAPIISALGSFDFFKNEISLEYVSPFFLSSFDCETLEELFELIKPSFKVKFPTILRKCVDNLPDNSYSTAIVEVTPNRFIEWSSKIETIHSDKIFIACIGREVTEMVNKEKEALDRVHILNHEIRNRAMSAQLLKTMEDCPNGLDCPDCKEKFKLATDSLTDLGSIMEMMLESDKLEAGKAVLHPENFDLHELLKSVVQEFPNMPIEMPQLGSHIVMADKHKLRQVITNLMSNAAKYTDPQRGIELSYSIKADQLSIIVKDFGLGINRKDIGKLFKKYSRLDPEGLINGTGLGLYLVQKLCECMGGHACLLATGPSGSTFGIEIPISIVENIRESSCSSVSNFSNFKALVVDDDKISQLTIATILKNQLNFKSVESASSALEAYEALLARPPDILLTDYFMPPGENGADLIGRVRQLQQFQALPIVLITGSTDSLKALQDDPYFSYMQKPITPPSLAHVLKGIFRAMSFDRDDVFPIKTIKRQAANIS